MLFKKLVSLLLLIVSCLGYSQIPELSPLSKISVLTCGSGDQLYTTFGHSAFRVQDSTVGIDVVYNYGVFDFNSSNFYVKFTQGKLDYTLARQRFSRFLDTYEYEERWVIEQDLDLSQTERNELFQFLETNYLPENRGYQYDFFFNNCATKIWDVLKQVFGDKLSFDESYIKERFTHRELIRRNMPVNSWADFGIDIALGSVIDDPATPKEHMFLPDYIMQQLSVSTFDTKPIVTDQKSLYTPKTVPSGSNFIFSPLCWALIFMIIIVWITYKDHKSAKRSRWVDVALFVVTGLIGVLIFFLWFLTDHTETANNFNLLWAFPFNLMGAFLIWRNKPIKKWITVYLLVLILMLFSVGIVWITGIQIFSPVLIPILLALLTRYAFLYLSNRSKKQ